MTIPSAVVAMKLNAISTTRIRSGKLPNPPPLFNRSSVWMLESVCKSGV